MIKHRTCAENNLKTYKRYKEFRMLNELIKIEIMYIRKGGCILYTGAFIYTERWLQISNGSMTEQGELLKS